MILPSLIKTGTLMWISTEGKKSQSFTVPRVTLRKQCAENLASKKIIGKLVANIRYDNALENEVLIKINNDSQ